jgi:hypothetical protein
MTQLDTPTTSTRLRSPDAPIGLPQSAFSSSLDVAIELVNEVISYIQDDVLALRLCSLVCKAWVPLSRQHLFFRIYLDHTNISAFISLLQSNSGSSIGRFVQHLRIARGLRNPVWMEDAVPILSMYLHPTCLHLQIENSIETELEGDSREFDEEISESLQVEDLSVFHDAFQEVVELKLSLDCDTFAEGAELLATFPLLERLNILRDWCSRDAEISYDTMFLPSHVRSIYTYGGTHENFFQWLLHQPHPRPPISSLVFDNTQITKSISSFIQNLGANLQHLSFYPNCHPYDELIHLNQRNRSPRDCIDLTHNTALRSITIKPRQEEILTVLDVLSQVRSDDVEKVEIVVLLRLLLVDGDPDASSPQRWSELDQLLASPRFSKLQRVGILFSGYAFGDVENLLPLCKSRGILALITRA